MEDSLLGWWSSDLVLFHFPDELMFIFFFLFSSGETGRSHTLNRLYITFLENTI